MRKITLFLSLLVAICATAQPTFTPINLETGEISTGWYQIKPVVSHSNFPTANGKYASCIPAKINGYNWALTLVDNKSAVSTFVYIINNNNGTYSFKSATGKYVANNAIVSDNQANLNITAPDDDKTHLKISGEGGHVWTGWASGETYFVGSSSSTTGNCRFQISSVNDYVNEHYDVYTFEPPYYLNTDAITYIDADYTGVGNSTPLYAGGVVFITKGGSPKEQSGTLFSIDEENKILRVCPDAEHVDNNWIGTIETNLAESSTNIGMPGYIDATTILKLQELISTYKDEKTPENIINLLTAYEDGMNNPTRPVDGKAYYLKNIQQDKNKTYLLYFKPNEQNPEGLELATKEITEENTEDLSAVFVCHKVGEKYLFTNAAKGNYMVWRGKGNGYNADKGYNPSYVEAYCAFSVIPQSSDTRIGSFRLVSKRKDNSDGSLVLMSATGNFDAYSNSVGWASNFSNSFVFEEAEDYNMNNVSLKTPKKSDGYKYASLYLPYATTIPAGVEVFTATFNDDKTRLKLNAVDGTTLPKNTAVVVRSQNETAATFIPATEAGTEVAGNALAGTVYATDETPDNTYVLSGAFGEIGFYKYTADNLPAGKAYITKDDNTSEVQGLLFGEGDVTGIETVETANGNAACYDLSGRRVAQPKAGIYVCGGKKVYVK